MKRKVIQIANSTQLVSLPRKWTLRFGIQKGDELEVLESGSKLIISSDKPRVSYTTELDASTMPRFALRALNAMYKCGYEEVHLQFDDSELVPKMQSALTSFFPGYEIVEQRKNHLVIKDIGHQVGENFDTVLKRLITITHTMAENLYLAVKEGDFSNLNEIIILEQTNNRLANFCMRTLNKEGTTYHQRSHFLYSLVMELERLSDQYKYLVSYFRTVEKLELRPEILSIFSDMVEMISLTKELYTSYSPTKVDTLSSMKQDLLLRIIACENPSSQELHVLFRLEHCTRMIFHIVGNVVAVHS